MAELQAFSKFSHIAYMLRFFIGQRPALGGDLLFLR